jgi:hypothetical protein
MDPTRPVLIIFHGATGAGPAERLVASVRVAATRRTVALALEGGFEAVIIATDEPRAFAPGPRVVVDPDGTGVFDFEVRLKDVVARYGLERPAVMGSGSLPLAAAEDFRAALAMLTEGVVVTNNFFSSDLTAWEPGAAVQRLAGVARDNVLPRRLRDQAALKAAVLPRSTRTHFDLDTPADVCALAVQEGLAGELRAALPESGLPLERYRAVMRVLCDPAAELVVTGRVGSAAWQYFETETACRVRVFSEERGLAAAGPGHRARSVLGFLLESVGVEGFFARLMEMGDAFVIDTRVIEAHLGIEPLREARFQSDLLRGEDIADPFLREFTVAAANAPKPVILGGHSLVSGGLMALTDAAWLENDRLKGR